MSDFGFGGATRVAKDDPVPGASGYKTQVDSSGSTNTKGSWAQVAASTPFDVAGMLVTVQCSTGARSALFDIGVGPGASEVVAVSNVLLSFDRGYKEASAVYLPIAIPASTRVAIRHQSNAASADFYFRTHFVAAGSAGPVSYPVATTYGADTATSNGTTVTGSVSADVKGAYAQLTASTTYDTKWLLLCIAPVNVNVADISLDLAVGAAASEVIVIPDLYFDNETGAVGITPCFVSLPMAIPAGTRIAARIASTTGSMSAKVSIVGFS